jgi:hypothetical protein
MTELDLIHAAIDAAVLAERERCARICEQLAKYIEDGQAPRSPDRRLRQAAQYIRNPRDERPFV